MYVCIGKNENMLYSSELIKGTLRTIILKLLCDQQKMYGYEITQKVKDLTQNRIQLTEGALYPTLHAMENEGLLTTEVEYIGKRVRKYYSVSKQGKEKASEKINEFAQFMETMRVLLNLDLHTLKVQ
jgi:PadR family transcriptional regulator PadR